MTSVEVSEVDISHLTHTHTVRKPTVDTTWEFGERDVFFFSHFAFKNLNILTF